MARDAAASLSGRASHVAPLGSGERRLPAIFAVPPLRTARLRECRISRPEFCPAAPGRQRGFPRVAEEISPSGAAILWLLFLKQEARTFLRIKIRRQFSPRMPFTEQFGYSVGVEFNMSSRWIEFLYIFELTLGRNSVETRVGACSWTCVRHVPGVAPDHQRAA